MRFTDTPVVRVIKSNVPMCLRLIAVACLVLVQFAATTFADQATRIRVACLGDSITAGARVDVKTESYPARLQQLVLAFPKQLGTERAGNWSVKQYSSWRVEVDLLL